MTNNEEATRHILEQTDAEIIIIENNELLNMILSLWDGSSKLKCVVLYGEEVDNKILTSNPKKLI